MKRTSTIFIMSLALSLLIYAPAGAQDTTPPEWDFTEGVRALAGEETGVRVFWNGATDTQSPPVVYKIYYSETSPPFAGSFLLESEPEPGGDYEYSTLITAITPNNEYYFGVRALDSADPPNEDDNMEEKYILWDPEPPYTEGFYPADGETGVPLDADIYFDLKDDGNGVDLSSLQLQVNDEEVSGIVSEIDPPYHYFVEYSPPGGWNTYEEVRVSVRARDNDTYNYMLETVEFTTIDLLAPTVDGTAPENGADGVSMNTAVIVLLSDVGIGLDLQSIDITVEGTYIVQNGQDQTGGNVQFRGDAESYLIRYNPDLPFSAMQVVDVQVDASDAQDPPNAMTTYNFSFTTGTTEDIEPPVWDDMIGVQSAEGSSDTSIRIRWEEASDASSPPVSFNVYYSQTSPAIAGTKLEFVDAEYRGGTWVYNLEGLEEETLYFVTVRAQDNASPPNEDGNLVEEFAVSHDTAPPFTDRHDPERYEEGVDPRTDLVVHVNDEGNGVDESSILMTVNGEEASVEITGSPADYELRYSSLVGFGDNQTVYVTVDAQDLSDPPAVMTQDAYWFTTKDVNAPYAGVFIPGLNETDVAINTKIQTEFYDQASGVDINEFDMSVNDLLIVENGEDLTGGLVTITDVDGDQTQYIVVYSPAQNFDPNNEQTVEMHLADQADPPNEGDIIYDFYTGSIEDTEAPVVDQYSPEPGEGAAPDTDVYLRVKDIEAGIDRSTLNVTVDGIQIVENGEPVAPYDVIVGGNRFKIPIRYTPDENFEPGSEVTVIAEAYDFSTEENYMLYEYSFPISVDSAAPYTAQNFPAKSAGNVYRNADIYMNVKDEMTGVDPDTVSIEVNGAPVSIDDIYPIYLDRYYHVFHDNETVFDAGSTVEVRVQASDRWSPPNTLDETYTFTVGSDLDETDPEAEITYPEPGQILAGEAFTVEGTMSDGESGIYKVYFANVNTWPPSWNIARQLPGGTWEINWSPFNPGEYDIACKARDNASNESEPYIITVCVDKTLPSSVVINPPHEGYVGGGEVYTITGSANDSPQCSGIDYIEVSTDGGQTFNPAVGTEQWSYEWTLPESGTYTILSKATDLAGWTELPEDGHRVTVDQVPPESAVTDPIEGSYIGGETCTIMGTASDDVAGVDFVEVSVDNGVTWDMAQGAESWSYLWELGEDGVYHILSRAVDNATNEETSPGPAVNVTVDTIAPASDIADPEDGAFLSGTTYTITGTASDNVAGVEIVEVSYDGGQTWLQATGTDSWSLEWTLPEDGEYELISRATDFGGNEETPGESVGVFVDNTAPTSLITDPPDGGALNGDQYTITGTAEDNLTGVDSVEISTDNGMTWLPVDGTENWSFQWTLPGEEGAVTLYTKATDSAGNIETPAEHTVTIDRTPPQSIITHPGEDGCVGGGVYTIEGTASDALTSVETVEISVDDGATWHEAEGTENWSYQWTIPGDGNYILKSRATDIAGNIETPQPGREVEVDLIPPDSDIVDPQNGDAIGGETYTVAGTAQDQGCGLEKVEISVDGGDTWSMAQGLENWSYVWNLPDQGMVTISSRATDIATNVQTDITTVEVLIDNIPPESDIQNLEDGQTIGGTEEFIIEGTASDDGAGVQYVEISTDGGQTWEQASGSVQWTYVWQLQEGLFEVQSRAVDELGNAETPKPPVFITVDLTPPNILVGGYWTTRITSEDGGNMILMAISLDEDLEKLEIAYQGEPLGLELNDEGTNGDMTAGDYLYTMTLPFGPGVNPLQLVVEIQAVDHTGNIKTWPYMIVR